MNKKIRLFVLVLVALATIGAMFMFVNTYIYNFFAATPKVSVSVTPSAASVNQNQEFTVGVRVANQNIDAINLYLTYDNSKVQYYNEYTPNALPGTGYTQLPERYFTDPIIEENVTVGNKKQLHVVLVALGAVRQKSVQVNFKFKSLTSLGDAVFTVDSQSAVSGVDDSNVASYFEKDPAVPTGTISILPGVPTSITPSVIPSVIPSGTPPWVNTNYNTTTVWGIVRLDKDAQGQTLTNEYWRKDISVCPNKPSYPSSATMNIKRVSTGLDSPMYYLDKCQGFNDVPYFLGVTSSTGSQSYQIAGIPAGYECIGWEHRLRTTADASFTVAEGTGCTTTSQAIDVKRPESGYHNSHFFIFKLKKLASGTETITGVPISITPTRTPKPPKPITDTTRLPVNAQVTMKIRFQGVTNPKSEYSKQVVEVGLWTNSSSNQKVEFTYADNGVWVGTFDLKNVYASENFGPYYALYVKGPKHIRKKICDVSPSESLPGTYKCRYGNIQFKTGVNELDFTNIILLAGDLPIQDGVVNSLDFAYIRQNFGSTDTEALQRADLNFDGIVHTDDHTLVKTALEFKYDEE